MNARNEIETSQKTNGCSQAARPARGLKVRTAVSGGRISANHNQALRAARGLKVRTAVCGGRIAANHNQALRAAV